MAGDKGAGLQWRLIVAAQAACVLEADAPKAGNVTRYHDFSDTTLEDFHISGLLIGPVLNYALQRGVGETILRGARLTREFVGSNTNLGILLMLSPLAASWLALQSKQDAETVYGEGLIKTWREETHRVLQALTVDDATAVYEAIRLCSPGGLGSVPSYDVQSGEQPSITLLEAMCLSAGRDMIGEEYCTNFSMVFDIALPALEHALEMKLPMPKAIAQTHLKLLALRGDSLIKRKKGDEATLEVQRRAQQAFDLGGLQTEAGTQAFEQLDAFLRHDGNSLNPGSTADIVAAAIFVYVLAGRNGDGLAL